MRCITDIETADRTPKPDGLRVPVTGVRVLAVAVFTAVMTSVYAAPPATPRDLSSAVEEYDRAQIAGDKEGLTRLLADDYLLVNGAGEVETKTEFIAESVDPAFKLDPFTVLHAVSRVWSDGAVLAGEVNLTGSSNGKRFMAHTRFADVWAKRAGRWQVVFTQVTRIPSKPQSAP